MTHTAIPDEMLQALKTSVEEHDQSYDAHEEFKKAVQFDRKALWNFVVGQREPMRQGLRDSWFLAPEPLSGRWSDYFVTFCCQTMTEIRFYLERALGAGVELHPTMLEILQKEWAGQYGIMTMIRRDITDPIEILLEVAGGELTRACFPFYNGFEIHHNASIVDGQHHEVQGYGPMGKELFMWEKGTLYSFESLSEVAAGHACTKCCDTLGSLHAIPVSPDDAKYASVFKLLNTKGRENPVATAREADLGELRQKHTSGKAPGAGNGAEAPAWLRRLAR